MQLELRIFAFPQQQGAVIVKDFSLRKVPSVAFGFEGIQTAREEEGSMD